MQNCVILYEVRQDVVCDKCGNKGAVKAYGTYYPHGKLEKDKGLPRMEKPYGLGGIIPWRCLNCDNCGAIDRKELEMTKKAFTSIKVDDEKHKQNHKVKKEDYIDENF